MISSRRTLACEELLELVTDYLEGRLSRRTRRAFDRHLARCPHCCEYLAQMRRSIELTGRLADEPVPDDLLDALQRAYLEEFGPDT
jgi:anti-sigma factor RsiW